MLVMGNNEGCPYDGPCLLVDPLNTHRYPHKGGEQTRSYCSIECSINGRGTLFLCGVHFLTFRP